VEKWRHEHYINISILTCKIPYFFSHFSAITLWISIVLQCGLLHRIPRRKILRQNRSYFYSKTSRLSATWVQSFFSLSPKLLTFLLFVVEWRRVLHSIQRRKLVIRATCLFVTLRNEISQSMLVCQVLSVCASVRLFICVFVCLFVTNVLRGLHLSFLYRFLPN